MKKRVLGVVAALLLAAVGTLAVLSYVRSTETRLAAGQRMVDVLVVSEPIPQGASAEAVASKVKSTQVPAKVQAANGVDDLASLAGLVTSVDLVPGEQVVASRFVDPAVLEAATRQTVEVPPGLLEVTVSLAADRAVGGQIVPGDTVAFFASFEPFQLGAIEPTGLLPDELLQLLEELNEAAAGSGSPDDPSQPESRPAASTPNSTAIILHKVLVTNVQVEQLPRELEGESDSTVQLAPTGKLLVTLAITAGDAERIVFTAEHGTIWLAKEPLDANEDGTGIQTRGSIYE